MFPFRIRSPFPAFTPKESIQSSFHPTPQGVSQYSERRFYKQTPFISSRQRSLPPCVSSRL